MKKLLFLMMMMALPLLGSAQPVIDGTNDGPGTWGTAKGTHGTEGWDNAHAKEIYVTYDASYVYFGALVTARRWQNGVFAINFKSGGDSTDAWERKVTYSHANAPDIQLRMDYNGGLGNDGYYDIRKWNGAEWSSSSAGNEGTEYAQSFDSSVGDNDLQTDQWVEIRVPRAQFDGATEADVQFLIVGNNSNNGSFSSIPDDNKMTEWNEATSVSNYITSIQIADIVTDAITDAPSLSSPSDASTEVFVREDLTWTAVTNATTYRVQISTDSTFSSTVVDETTDSTTYTPAGGVLAPNTTYYWRVRGENTANQGPYSTIRSFTTGGTFTVYFNNFRSWTNLKAYVWKSSNDKNLAEWPGQAMTSPEGSSPWYSFVIPNGFDRVIFNGDTTGGTRQTADLERTTTGWFNGTTWSDTNPDILSAGPTLTTPANNANDVAVATDFEWEALANATTYTIEISTNSDFSSPLVSTTATSPYDLVGNLSFSTTYYWRVRGTNYAGDSDWSSASFTTTAAPTIGTITLIAPVNDDVDQSTTPTLTWNAATNATGYRVQISTTSGDYNLPVVNTTVSSATSYQVASALSYSTKYFWRVQGTADGFDDGPFSTEFSFTTMAQPSVGTLTLTAPTVAATDVSIRPTFEWSSATNATTYRLQLSTDNFSTTAFETTTASTTYTIGAANQLTGNTDYQWRVRGEAEGHINGDYASGSFTTQQTFTLYYSNPNGWTTVKAYVWTTDTPDVPFVTYPGEDMTAPVTGSWYSYTVPVGYNRVIFNRNSGDNIPADKTADLERSTTGYYIGDGTTNLWSDTEPLQGVYTVQAGNWDATSTWNGGILPTSNDTVTIAHNVTLNVSDTVHTIIINSGVTFTAGTNTLTLSSGGTFSNSGTINTGTSTIAFLGSGAITGSPALYNLAIAGGVAVGSGTTIHGTLTINAGGYLAQSKGGTGLTASSQVPNFGQSATLAYTGTFEYGNENFAGGFGNTEGKIPFNLTVAGNGALTITQNARTLAGKLTVESGAFLTTNGFLTLKSGAKATVDGTLTGNITIEQEISGTQGWRLLAAPVNSTTLSDITSGLWTQGFTGASTTEGNANVRFWNGSDYVVPSNITDAVAAGTGYAMLIFADDNFDGQADAFPKTMNVTGGWVNADVEVNLNQGNDVFTLVGNPFFSTIDFDNVTASNLYTTVYVYDQSTGQFISWNGETGGLTEGLVAPFQGFFVVNNSNDASTLTIPTSARTIGGVLHKEGANTPVVAFTSRLGELSNSAYLSFTETGAVGKDHADAVKLDPLDIQPYLSVSTYNGSSYLDINNLPAELNAQLEIPVFVSAYSPENGVWNALTGEAMISWSELANMPESWVVELVDNETGETINMREVNQYSFMLTAPVAKQRAVDQELTPRMFSAEGSSRFTLKVGPFTTSVEGLELPNEVTLNQNYPNPFNPSTQISFALPQAMNVSVKVYDMLGREVATLFNGAATAGTTNVQFNASNMSSGMYYYRLQAGEHSITKKMMLVK